MNLSVLNSGYWMMIFKMHVQFLNYLREKRKKNSLTSWHRLYYILGETIKYSHTITQELEYNVNCYLFDLKTGKSFSAEHKERNH